jgi:hypothetical protein
MPADNRNQHVAGSKSGFNYSDKVFAAGNARRVHENLLVAKVSFQVRMQVGCLPAAIGTAVANEDFWSFSRLMLRLFAHAGTGAAMVGR